MLQEYFSDHIPVEEQKKMKEYYNKIINSKSGQNWMVDGMRNALKSHKGSMEFAAGARDKIEYESRFE